MADVTSLIELMELQHKEQMEKQDRQHAKQMAVLIEKVKSRHADMKHLIEAARDGAKGRSTPVAIAVFGLPGKIQNFPHSKLHYHFIEYI